MKCDFLLSRILSVFNLLKRVGFAVLFYSMAHIAHPQDIIWQREGDTESSRFGGRILPLGDQNDDGFSDWAVYFSDTEPEASLNGLHFFHGGNPPSNEPYLTFRGMDSEPPIELVEYYVADFNGDGYKDWVF